MKKEMNKFEIGAVCCVGCGVWGRGWERGYRKGFARNGFLVE